MTHVQGALHSKRKQYVSASFACPVEMMTVRRGAIIDTHTGICMLPMAASSYLLHSLLDAITATLHANIQRSIG